MDEKKHIDYSAADIERYHKGLMTAKEMNALEKAALDDPFLADAIEGYALVPVNAEEGLSILNKKLDERINDSKVIPLKKSNFPWLRVAAAFIIIVGVGVLAYNSLFQFNKQEVAATEKKDTVSHKSTFSDTTKEPVADTTADVTKTNQEKVLVKSNELDKKIKPSTNTKENNDGYLELNDKETKLPAAAPEKLNDVTIKKDEAAATVKTDSIKAFARVESKAANKNAQLKNTDDFANVKKAESNDKAKSLNEVTISKGIAAQNNKVNYFRGQVTDANNSPLPFANVTIVPDNIGTYTDAKGNFVLISPDSVLNVKIRSVGFENNSASLQNNIANNSIVLQQDTKNIPATVLNTKRTGIERKRQDNMTVEEPEPADGWYNYDTYIANNMKISDEIKTKAAPSSQVELSFEVNKYGEPVNIKVEKSVCKECDEEAIRLLKEGPKWKKNKKNKRAKVSVGFSQTE